MKSHSTWNFQTYCNIFLMKISCNGILCMKNIISSFPQITKWGVENVWEVQKSCSVFWIIKQQIHILFRLTLTFETYFVSREFQIRFVFVAVRAHSEVDFYVDFGIFQTCAHQSYTRREKKNTYLKDIKNCSPTYNLVTVISLHSKYIVQKYQNL